MQAAVAEGIDQRGGQYRQIEEDQNRYAISSSTTEQNGESRHV